MGGGKADTQRGKFPHVSFSVEEVVIQEFLLLLQYGFGVIAHVGCSVNDFIQNEIGAGPDTMEKIQSVFLDGSPVDDLDAAIVRDGARLALSAAMPGLVGATLRRGGIYATFRGSITYRETGIACAAGNGLVRLKLFNLLLNELGPALLKKGILVAPSDLADFLKMQSGDFWRKCRRVSLDGVPISPESLKDPGPLSGAESLLLTVTASN